MKIETFLQLILLLPTAFQFHIKLSVNTALLLGQTTEQKRNENNLKKNPLEIKPSRTFSSNNSGSFVLKSCVWRDKFLKQVAK